jgi:hypothetical protein
MLNVTILSPSLLPLTFVKLDIRGVQVTAVLLKSTHLGVFGLDPLSVEVVVPEQALVEVDIASVSTTRYALELVGTRVTRRGRKDWRISFHTTLTHSTASSVLFGPVRASAHQTSAGGPARRCGVTPSPAILTTGYSGVFCSHCTSAWLTVDKDVFADEGLRVGATGGIPDVEVNRGPSAMLGLTDNGSPFPLPSGDERDS